MLPACMAKKDRGGKVTGRCTEGMIEPTCSADSTFWGMRGWSGHTNTLNNTKPQTKHYKFREAAQIRLLGIAHLNTKEFEHKKKTHTQTDFFPLNKT